MNILFLIGLLLFNISSVYADTAKSAVQYLMYGNDCLNQNDLDQAIVEYSKALDINPNYAKAYDNRGVAYAREGSSARAIADFTMAIANNLNDSEAYNNRGRAYADRGDFYQAIYDYSKSIEINPIYAKAYNNRGQAYFNLKKYDRAWADVNKIKTIGGAVDSNFIEELKKASGKDQ